jgi:hypothetical protein
MNNCTFCIYGFRIILIISLSRINHLIFVMVKCCVLFEVRTEFLKLFKQGKAFKSTH